MRRLMVVTVVLLAFASFPATVSASNGAATPFKAAFSAATPDGFADFTCSGAHIVNKTVKDSETCLITGDTNGFVAGTYFGNPTADIPPLGVVPWFSDFNSVQASRFIATFVDHGDGTWTNYIVAYYT
ncbi:MAG: hypothetical protein E6J18_14155 [Chloroflexi bacterium]|nr:MAG: hypothetical protein E6J37_00555 [Chloroflexota bacterium]TMC68375.1 MAG: hypothetical protein E6J18_14155 [Chloroflexota bacterium]